MSDKFYICIDEHNGNEGETFGYFYPQNDETLTLLEKIKEKSNCYCGDNSYSFHTNVTMNDIITLNKFDVNGYSARVVLCDTNEALDSLRALADSAHDMPYKGSFGVAWEERSYGMQPVEFKWMDGRTKD